MYRSDIDSYRHVASSRNQRINRGKPTNIVECDEIVGFLTRNPGEN